jgi:hypothetical protein
MITAQVNAGNLNGGRRDEVQEPDGLHEVAGIRSHTRIVCTGTGEPANLY